MRILSRLRAIQASSRTLDLHYRFVIDAFAYKGPLIVEESIALLHCLFESCLGFDR